MNNCSLANLRKFYFCKFNRISSKEIASIFKAFKHLKDLSFDNCKLGFSATHSIKGITGVEITKLSFEGCGKESTSNWVKQIPTFENLIKWLSQCAELRYSLREINFKACGWKKRDIKPLLVKYKFDKDIKILA